MKQTQFSTFNTLHHQSEPLMLNNVWDAAGAAILTASGSKAIATSSASLAWSCGYSDGACLPIKELLASVQRIKHVTHLPVSIDIEDGYSDSPTLVAKLVRELTNIGIVGINIEDGQHPPELLNEKIKAIRELSGEALFINARTDVYLQSLVTEDKRLSECLARTNHYIEAGANGVFIPGTLDSNIFGEIAQNIQSPVNAMVSAFDDSLRPLIDSGVTRFSLGPTPFLTCYSQLSYQSGDLSYDKMNALF